MSERKVTVTLLPLFEDTHIVRTIEFTENDTTIAIGRSSKREARKRNPEDTNGWFDSRVMSRDHALLNYSPRDKMIFICDCGSTHGTFVNDAKLVPNVDSPLFSGDIIRFGVSVDRGHEVFEALEVRCNITWPKAGVFVLSSQDVAANVDPSPSTNSFSVPEDDSDVESADSSSGDASDESADGAWESTTQQPASTTPTSSVFSCKDGEHQKGEGERPTNEPLVVGCVNPPKPSADETGVEPMPIPTLVPSLPSPPSDSNSVSDVGVSVTKPVSDVDFSLGKPADCDLAWAAEAKQALPDFPVGCYQDVPESEYSDWSIMRPFIMRIADMAWGQSDVIPDVDHENRVIHAARRCSFPADAYWVDDAPSFRPCVGTEISWEPDTEESDTSFHRMPGSLLRYWSVDKRRFWVIKEKECDRQMSNWWWLVEKPQELMSEELKLQLATEAKVEDCHKYWIVRVWKPQMIGGRWCDVAPYWDPSFDEGLLTDDESVDSDEGCSDEEYPEENGDDSYGEDENAEEDEDSDGSQSDADHSSDDESADDLNELQRESLLPLISLARPEHTDAAEVSKHVPEEPGSEKEGLKAFEFVPTEPLMTYQGAQFPAYDVSTVLPESCHRGLIDPMASFFSRQYNGASRANKTVYHDGPFASNTSGKSSLKRSATEMDMELESSAVSDFSQDAQRLPEDPSILADFDKLTAEAKEAISSALAENVSATAANDHPAKRVKYRHSTARTLASHAVTAAVSLVVGGVGTIAALAAMPNKYFQ
ncbi:hypothetical protein N7535_007797 [Penicillium sp. DV-2018c]|nr:hypothetical protein N7535_007797 [Penicillium sp. DV-2018c]